MLFSTVQLSLRCLRRPCILKLRRIELTIRKENISGWVHRKPVAVLNEKIVFEDDEEAPKPGPRKHVSEDPEHRPMKERKKHQPPKKSPPKIYSDETFKEDGAPNIMKFADDERKLSALIVSLKSRKMREKQNRILLEGHRLIQDAIKAQLAPEIILFSRKQEFEKLSLPPKGVKLYKVPYETLKLWSDLITSPGIMGIFKCPESFENASTDETLPLTIICDNVREPGNLGTILRAAAGVGCERIILTKGCVDVWESKVLRSAAGAHFRVSISKSVEWNTIKSLISPNANIFVADNNVANNLEDKTGSLLAEIPLDSEENSNDENSTDALQFVSESNFEHVNLEEFGEKHLTEDTIDEAEYPRSFKKAILQELSNRIPVVPYYAADYTNNEVVLIIGGETEGLSYESIKLVKNKNGIRVNIPLTNEVESLNTSMALGIVAFEIKRQFALRKAATTNN